MNKLAEDVCRILGHDFGIKMFEEDSTGRITLPTFELYAECTRCLHKVGRTTIKYSELMTRKYDVLSRAKERIEIQIEESNKPQEP